MKILLWGWNGHKNLGDDLMTFCIVSFIKNKFPDSQIYILGRHYNMPMEIRDKTRANIGVRFILRLPFINVDLKKKFFAKIWAKKFTNIIIGGGSVFHQEKTNSFYGLVAEQISKLSGKKIFSVATSIGPFPNDEGEKSFIKYMNFFSGFSVRDKRSIDYLMNNRALDSSVATNYSPDLAFSLPYFLKLEERQFDLKTIGIAITKNAFDEKTENSLIASLAFLLHKKDYRLKIFCLCNSPEDNLSDVSLANQYKNALSEFGERVEIVQYKHINKFISDLITCKHIIAVRLHSAIIRYAYRKSFIIIPYHQKCFDLAKDLSIPQAFLIKKEDLKEDSLYNVIAKDSDGAWSFDDTIGKKSKGHLEFIYNELKV